MEDLIKAVQETYQKSDLPEFQAGDTVEVDVLIREGEKERIQRYRGVCLQRRGDGATETFTVRKISSGVGVERIFPIHSPSIAEIRVLRRGKVRRARLFYLREKIGKQARIKERRR